VLNGLKLRFASVAAVAVASIAALACVSEPEESGLQFSPIERDDDASNMDCGHGPCAYTAAITAADGLTAQLYLSESAFLQGSNDFRVVLSVEETESCELAELYAVMPAHAHMSEPTRIEGASSGYLIENLALTMPGQWQMTLVADHRKRFEPLTFTIDVQ
jgi:hypothetical protein